MLTEWIQARFHSPVMFLAAVNVLLLLMGCMMDILSAVFITVPPLNDERRQELVKAVKHMAEEAKVALRNIRRDANHELAEMEKENELTEDDLRLGEGEVQKLTDEFSHKIDDRVKAKEADILEV